MPDLLLDALPVIDLLEITGSTSAVAQLTERDQSSVSRIYRQASDRLGLQFGKGQDGTYRAGANQALLRDLRRSSQRLRLLQPARLRWLGCRWSPRPEGHEPIPPALGPRWRNRQRLCQQVRDHLLDLAVLPGLELLPESVSPGDAPAEIPLDCGTLLALPLLRQPLLITAPHGHPLHSQPDPVAADLRRWPLLPPEPQGDPVPRLRQQLLSRGLRFADGHRHRRAPPPLQLLPALDLPTHPWGDPSQSLSITSGLEDLDLVVLRRDLWGEPAVTLLLEALEAIHHRRFGDRDDLTLLR